MPDRICPRSPREVMCGWVHLPRFVDKIRLQGAGKLHLDYQTNFTQGFDGRWLEAAGVAAETFIAIVNQSLTDGEVCDWVRRNVQRTDAQKQAFNQLVLNRGTEDDEVRARLERRKQEYGFGHRSDVRTFVDLIEADEGRM